MPGCNALSFGGLGIATKRAQPPGRTGNNSLLAPEEPNQVDPDLMTSPVCPSCGEALAQGSPFCGSCGIPVSVQTMNSQSIGQIVGLNTPFRGTKYIVDQKILAVRDTFGIKDTSGTLLAYVKRQLLSFGPKFWYEGTDGARLGEIHGKVLTIRPTFEIYDAEGQLQAVIKRKILNLLGTQWWMENSSGQEIAKAHGNMIVHDYKIQAPDGSPIAQIHKKWITVRDSYCVEIQSPSFDPYLVLSYAISMDHTEGKKGPHLTDLLDQP